MSREGTKAWKSTQPDCLPGHSIIIYFLILSGAQNWVDHTPQFLAQLLPSSTMRSSFIFLFCFVPFINHPWSHPPSHMGTHSRVFNIRPSNPPFMCLFTYMCICEKIYGIVMCFNLHKQYCTINLVLFLFSLNILFLSAPAMLPYVELIHASGHLIHIYHIFPTHSPGDGALGGSQFSTTIRLRW